MILRYFLIYLRPRIISALFLQYLLQLIRCHKYIFNSILIQALCNLTRSVSPLLCVCLIQYNYILCLLWTAFSPALLMTCKLYQVLFCHLIFCLFSKKFCRLFTSKTNLFELLIQSVHSINRKYMCCLWQEHRFLFSRYF